MPEEVVHFADTDQVRTVLGDRDRHLRRVRDELGVKVVHRGDALKVIGGSEETRLGRRVFEELRAVVQRSGRLENDDVSRALGLRVPPRGDRPGDRQGGRGGFDARSGANRGGGDRDGRGAGGSIDLHERSRSVTARTDGQARYLESIARNDLVFCTGPAGCGKTYLAVASAIAALREDRVRKIVLARPAVEAGEKLGFLPGDMLAKVNPYLRPLLDALNDMLDYAAVRRYMAKDMIEVVPLAFMRGRTLNGTCMILDEAQNSTVSQMKMFLTRMGEGSRVVVTGDVTQDDLPDDVPSGLGDAVTRLRGIEGVGVVELGREDIVRHRLVRDIVQAYDGGDPPRAGRPAPPPNPAAGHGPAGGGAAATDAGGPG